MTTRNILVVLLVLVIVSMFFRDTVPLALTGPIGIVLAVLLILALVGKL